MERLVKAYQEYCWKEFYEYPSAEEIGGEIGVMYTTSEDESREYQATYYLDTLEFKCFIDGVVVYYESYKSLDDIADELESCSFDDYYSWVVNFDEFIEGEENG